MRFDLATAADDAAIRGLLRATPLAGEVGLTFEREPDSALAGGIQGDVHQTLVAREEAGGPIIGMGSRSLLELWVDGAPARVGYLSQLRVDAAHRGHPRGVLKAYRFLRELHGDGAVPYYLTTIVADNRTARRLLEADLPGMPRYRALDRLVTLALPARTGRARGAAGVAIERVGVETLDDVVACLERHGRRHPFAPRWTRATLLCPRRARGLAPGDFLLARRGGRAVACLALWDQRAFKQTVVRRYGPRTRLLRPLLNAAAPLLGIPALPRCGEPLRSAFASHAAADADAGDALVALVAAALGSAAARGLDSLAIGFAERDPLGRAVAAAFPCRRYASILYTVHWEDGAEAVARLGGRIPHPEVAIL